MGKNDKVAHLKEKLSPYEKGRLKTLEANAAIMKAKGFSTNLLNKVLQEKYERFSKDVDADVCSERVADQQSEVLLKMKCSRGKKEKFMQTLPMAEFSKLKGQERKLISEHQKPKEKVQSYHIQENGQSHIVQEQLQPRHVQQHQENQQIITNNMQQLQSANPQISPGINAQQNQKNYCSPGSMTRYANMMRLKGFKSQGSNDITDLQQAHSDTPLSNEVDISEDAEHSENDVVNASDLLAENENAVTQVKKHRGRTILADIHGRSLDERDDIILDDLNQPVGPTEEIVQKFTRFLGTLARDSNYAPLNIISWRYMHTKEKIWEYVQKKFRIDQTGKRYVLASVNSKWRVYKTRLKKDHYSSSETIEEMMKTRPKHIPEDEFKELLEYWALEDTQEVSKKNKENRAKQDDMHTMGPSSFSMLRHELKQSDPNKKSPLKADLYRESRRRKDDRMYLTQNEKTIENIEKMSALKSLDDGSSNYDPYYDVITKKEHSGRLRLHGLGVTKSTLMKRNSNAPYVLPPVFIESITQEFEKKVHEVEKRQEERFEQRFSEWLSKIKEANPGVDIVIPGANLEDVAPTTNDK